MKISKLRLKDFAKFEDFEIVFNDGVTNLVGINGAGKTTVGLTSLWAGFKGIAEKSKTGALPGQRFRFIAEGKKSLDIEITLHDEKTERKLLLKRHITKTTNTIKIIPEDDTEIDRQYVEDLFNVSFLSATHFSALTGVQQAEAMGIDVSRFDKDLTEKKDEAKDLRRKVKDIGTLTPVEYAEPVDIEEVLGRRAIAVRHNQRQNDISDCIRVSNECVTEYKERIVGLQEDIKAHETSIAENRANVQKPTDLEEIDAEISNIVETNKKAAEYETHTKNQQELNRCNGVLDANKVEQGGITKERMEYLQSKSFGIKGLQVDEDGNLTKDGKLIRSPYFSKGELEILVARIGMNLNPELKVRFIDNFELLDDDNQEKLIKHLTKKGFQIITATVGKKVLDDNSVLLRECKIVEDLDDYGDMGNKLDSPGAEVQTEKLKESKPVQEEIVSTDDDEF